MTETKRYNTRGMNIDEIMKLVEKEIDELFEDKEEQFRIDLQDAAFPADDADECIESRRAEKIAWRKADTGRNATASARWRTSK